jgi:hypothetical protein
MPEFPRGECRSCGTPVSHFAPSCPNCHAPNQPNPVATMAALLAVMVIGAVIALCAQLFHYKDAGRTASEAADASPASAPSAGNTADYGWIVNAMAECGEEAKRKLDTLHFLIVPLTPTGLSLPGWSPSPIGDVGSSAKLLTSTDALIGLRNRALALYAKPLTFLVSDPATKTMYKWKPAVGVAALNARELGFDNFTLGFEMPDVADDVEWGPTIALSKGTCYWINPLVLARSRGG